MANIFDSDGNRLAEAALELPENGTTARLHHIRRGAGLLHYYFGCGKRLVLVETPDGQLQGRLHTRWEGIRRAWEITFIAAGAVPAGPPSIADAALASAAVAERQIAGGPSS